MLSFVRTAMFAVLLVGTPTIVRAGASSAPTTQALPSAAEFRQMVGRRFSSDEVRRLCESLPGGGRVTWHPEYYFLTASSAGLSLRFGTKDDTLQMVAQFAGGKEGFSRYAGELPSGLSFDDSRLEVEKKLGPPFRAGYDPKGEFSAIYERLGITVSYSAKTPIDPTARIVSVQMKEMEPGVEAEEQAARQNAAARQHSLSFRPIVDGPAGPTVDRMINEGGPTGQWTFVSHDEVVDESLVDNIFATRPEKRPDGIATIIKFTNEGAQRVKQYTAAHIGRRWGIVLDGRLIMAPMIVGEVPDAMLIDFGAKAPREETVKFLQRLWAIKFALPTTQP